MPDTSSHDATRPDALHTLTVRDLEVLFAHAGVVMSRRQVLRHCKAGTFHAVKLPGVNNVEEWLIAPNSVEKGIADIKVLQEQRLKRDATRRDTTMITTPEIANPAATDKARQDASRRHGVSEPHLQREMAPISPDASRHVGLDLNLFEHPYARRLEAQVAKWEGKYVEQGLNETEHSSTGKWQSTTRVLAKGINHPNSIILLFVGND